MTTTLDRINSYEKTERQQLLSQLQAGQHPKWHTFGYTKSFTSKATVDVVMSEEVVDRMGDLVMASGWSVDNFRKNPVLLWGHDHGAPPIGTVTGVHVNREKQLLGQLNFDMDDPFAESIANKFKSKILNAVSVGFRPIEFEKNHKTGGIIFQKSELLELSAVSIPALPSALAKAYGGGLLLNVKEDKSRSSEEEQLVKYLTWIMFGNNHQHQKQIVSLALQAMDALGDGNTEHAIRIVKNIQGLIDHQNSGGERDQFPMWLN